MNKKNILFVDDNENVISGIQRQLRAYRDQWGLFFANSGPQALEIMAQTNIDLIVTDMMMPEMRGDELLKIVTSQYPATVRVILSGYADEDSLRNGMEIAHQYINKPCSSEMLREAISQVFKIQACVNNPRIVASLCEANQLPSLPKIYQELNTAIADENITSREIADIFSRDMVLSAKLLQLVNSPFFGLNRKISSLTDAINLIGIKKLNNLVLSVHVKTAFPVTSPEMERYMEYLWQDASRVSELAYQIAVAEDQKEDRPDQAYLGGLLRNMGLLIFLSQGGDKLKTLLQQVKQTEHTVSELEHSIFGFTSSEAAAYVLSLWKIPPRIIEAILLQNNPSQTDYDGMNALTAVHVAASLLRPTDLNEYQRLFSIELDTNYLQRIDKMHRLPDWQLLANKILAQYSQK